MLINFLPLSLSCIIFTIGNEIHIEATSIDRSRISLEARQWFKNDKGFCDDAHSVDYSEV